MLHRKAAITPRVAATLLIGSLLVFAALALSAPSGLLAAGERNFMALLRQGERLSEPAGPDWLFSVFRDFTVFGGWPFMALLSVVLSGLFLLRRQWSFLVILLAVIIGETLITEFLKSLFARARPDFLPHYVEATSESFPSGHSASAAAVYLTLGLMLANLTGRRAIRIYTLIVTGVMIVLIGLSRIYLGVHYPTDVVAGWCVGAAWASAVWLIAWRLDRKAAAGAEKPN